ncbi:MAG: hypothetical protein WBC85_02865 [Planktotalea sp.]|uniref:hypothetical protein n=1 Tax=Planktotalea sp. TaxID=2029877 RepID=UPI003C765AD6
MKKRAFLFGLGAFGLAGCAKLRQSPVPVVQEGFVVKPVPVAQGNMTAFLPEGDTIYLSGSINEDTATGFAAVRDSNPKAKRLVFLQADGPAGSPEAMEFGRAVRAAGFSTHLRNDSVISGGAVDAFVGGTQRTMEEGAVIGVVRGADSAAHKSFATEMTGGDGYARFAEKFGGKRRPRPMTIAEIGAMGIVSANVGNALAAN